MTAQIVIHDGVTPTTGSVDRANTFVGSPFSLSNLSNTGVLGWRWTLFYKPAGSAAALSSTSIANPSITPDVPGSYLIRLETYRDAARTVRDDSDEQVIGIRYAAPLDWLIPAAGQTNQLEAIHGWAVQVNAILDSIHTALGGSSASTLQDAYNNGNTINVGAGPSIAFSGGGSAPTILTITTAHNTTAALALTGSALTRTGALLSITSNGTNPHAFMRMIDSGGNKLEVWPDGLRGTVSHVLQPSQAPGVGTGGFASRIQAGQGANGDGVTPGGTGGDLTIEAGQAGADGGGGAGVGGRIRIGQTHAIAIDSGSGASIEWTHAGILREGGAAAAPVAIGRANSAGSGSTRLARADHVHDGGVAVTRAIAASGNILTTDEVLLVSPTADVVLTLPATRNRKFVIKKATEAAWRVSLAPNAAELIEGRNSNYILPRSTMLDKGSWCVEGDGTNWHVRSEGTNYDERDQEILPIGIGTIIRTGEGSYNIRSADDGLPGHIAWAPSTTPRPDERRDGFGVSYLLESTRTNLLLRSEEFNDAAWTNGGGLTVTPNTQRAPDGIVDADSLVFTAAGGDQISQTFTAADNTVVWGHVDLIAAAPQTVRLVLLRKDGTETSVVCNVTTTWQRFYISSSTLAGGTTPAFIIRNGADALARTVFAWGAMVEVGTFPGTYIRTAGGTVTRNPDVRTIRQAEYDVRLLSEGFEMDISPMFSSAEFIAQGSGVHNTLLSTTSNDFLWFIVSGANLNLQVSSQGVTRITSGPITFSRHQHLKLILRPDLGTLEILQATTGNGVVAGTAFQFSEGPLYIGSLASISSYIFCRFAARLRRAR